MNQIVVKICHYYTPGNEEMHILSDGFIPI